MAVLRRTVFLAALCVCGTMPGLARAPVGSSAPRLEHHTLLLDAERVGQRLIAVGERGYVLTSDDGGLQWRATRTAGDATLTALARRGDRVWAVGHDATILQSRDGGTTWRRVHYAPQQQRPLLDIAFIDDLHGFAVGAYGYFLETRDGGLHWHARTLSEDDRHFNAITALADGTLLIAGEAGLLLRSTDRGASWQALASPYAGSWLGLLPVGHSGALVFGLRGNLYRSDDSGAHWVAVPSGVRATLMGGRVSPRGVLAVVGQEGVLLTSSDGARSFVLHPQPGFDAFSAVLPDRTGWWLFGERGAVRARLRQ